MKDLSKRTESQREKDIAYLASLPLKELRKKQDIVTQQKAMAYKQYVKSRKIGGSIAQLEKTGENLDIMWQDLFEAIDRREFKKPLWGNKRK